MIPRLALRLLGLRSALTSAFTWATASASRMLAVALCVSLAANVWLWRGWSAEQDGRAADKAAWIAASQANAAAQAAQVKALEAKSQQIAKEADHDYKIAVADARTATDRYADANRCTVRQAASVSAPSSPGQGNDPGVPAQVPADPDLVAVSRTDLQALTEWLALGVQAHNNAVDKIANGTAVPAIPDVEFGK